jgi:hypothetical protein
MSDFTYNLLQWLSTNPGCISPIFEVKMNIGSTLLTLGQWSNIAAMTWFPESNTDIIFGAVPYPSFHIKYNPSLPKDPNADVKDAFAFLKIVFSDDKKTISGCDIQLYGLKDCSGSVIDGVLDITVKSWSPTKDCIDKFIQYNNSAGALDCCVSQNRSQLPGYASGSGGLCELIGYTWSGNTPNANCDTAIPQCKHFVLKQGTKTMNCAVATKI